MKGEGGSSRFKFNSTIPTYVVKDDGQASTRGTLSAPLSAAELFQATHKNQYTGQ